MSKIRVNLLSSEFRFEGLDLATKKIPVLLTEDQSADLQRAFENLSAAKPDPLTADQIQAILQLAVDSWIAAMTGRAKYRSLNEQYLEWLGKIYNSVLAGEEPSERRLYDRVGFGYGQAQYLARALREMNRGVWRRHAISQLRSALNSRLTEAKGMVKDKRASESLRFTISKSSKVELDNLLATLSERKTEGVSFAKKIGAMSSMMVIELAASTVEPVIQAIDRMPEVK